MSHVSFAICDLTQRWMRHVSHIICECVMSYLAYEYKVSHISHMNKSQMIRETWHIHLCVKSQMNSTARSTECLCARHSAKSSHSVELRIFRQKSCVYSVKRALCSKHSAKPRHSVEFDSLSKSVLTTVCKVKTFCRIRLNVLTTFSRIRRISRLRFQNVLSTARFQNVLSTCLEHRQKSTEVAFRMSWAHVFRMSWAHDRSRECLQNVLSTWQRMSSECLEHMTEVAFRMSWAHVLSADRSRHAECREHWTVGSDILKTFREVKCAVELCGSRHAECFEPLTVGSDILKTFYSAKSSWSKETLPTGGGWGSIYYVSWSRAVCKRFHDEMRRSHLVVKSLTHGSWSGYHSTKKLPWGGEFPILLSLSSKYYQLCYLHVTNFVV